VHCFFLFAAAAAACRSGHMGLQHAAVRAVHTQLNRFSVLLLLLLLLLPPAAVATWACSPAARNCRTCWQQRGPAGS
jgi:hypothetical protein